MSCEFVSGNGLATFAGIEQGKCSERTILCLHGWLDNAASFTPLLEYLHRYHVIALDWPGHGHSSHRGIDAHYHFFDYVYDLLVLFEQQGWQSVDIVAHSMGGMIASAFASAYPEKVKSLTLIDSLGFITAQPDETSEQLRQGMNSRLKLREKDKPIHATLDSAIQARMVVSDLTRESAKLIVERGSIEVPGGVTWRADSRLRNTSPYRITMEQAVALVKNISCPVQLIYGEKGLDMVAKAIEYFEPFVPQLTKYKLVTGHHVHMEAPDKTAKIIDEFIQNTSKS